MTTWRRALSLRFKLGAPGFREKGSNPFVITVVLNGSELGTAQHAQKESAMEKASLITLHLLDPDGKSIIANIHHSDEVSLAGPASRALRPQAELKRLCAQIINAKQDEIKALAQSAAAAPLPTSSPLGGAYSLTAFGGTVFPSAGALTPMGFAQPTHVYPGAPAVPVPQGIYSAPPMGPYAGSYPVAPAVALPTTTAMSSVRPASPNAIICARSSIACHRPHFRHESHPLPSRKPSIRLQWRHFPRHWRCSSLLSSLPPLRRWWTLCPRWKAAHS